MQKKTPLVIVIIVVIALVVFVFYTFLNKPQQNVTDNGITGQKSGDAMMGDDVVQDNKDENAIMVKSGSYEAYSPEKLALAETGKVVLFFRASWCPYCKELDANIKANLNKIPEGVTILDVDYDNSSALKQKYAVTYQHTLVQVDASGNKIRKWVGSPTLAELLSNIE